MDLILKVFIVTGRYFIDQYRFFRYAFRTLRRSFIFQKLKVRFQIF